jgi:hypothetical protein
MRRSLFLLIVAFAPAISACSYSTDFVVVNESGETIQVRYKMKRFPNQSSPLTPRPAKIAVSQITTRDKRAWRTLSPDEFKVNEETRTVSVDVLPNEALWITSMFHYIGDEDPNDVAAWPIEEISLSGSAGSITFTGQEARKSFKYVSRVLYKLTYR